MTKREYTTIAILHFLLLRNSPAPQHMKMLSCIVLHRQGLSKSQTPFPILQSQNFHFNIAIGCVKDNIRSLSLELKILVIRSLDNAVIVVKKLSGEVRSKKDTQIRSQEGD
ncbi:hypothetical protein OUZ56_032207 [Daphnia magna]|uniref:Uncharacterized protein n=1 Tax=Daphnia magna TaxID=35525 RepID=A0ABQ9ZX97_9CRUS|nr:hypothetical protein OUZ56_032207 [Daphnia magna]